MCGLYVGVNYVPLDILKRDWPEMYQQVFDDAVRTGKIVTPISVGIGRYYYRGDYYCTEDNIYYYHKNFVTGSRLRFVKLEGLNNDRSV